jgi:hypothetical protein
MKRKPGVGDALIALGLLMMLAFLIVGFATCSGKGGGAGMVAVLFAGAGNAGEWAFGWGSVTSIVLWLVMLGAGGLQFLSLTKGDTRLLNVLYGVAGFMILLHLPIQVSSYAGIGSPLSFYIFLGALLVGMGTYLVRQGGDLIMGHGKKEK